MCIQNKQKKGQQPKGIAWLMAGLLCCFCSPMFAWIPFVFNSMYTPPTGGYDGNAGIQIQQQQHMMPPPPQMMSTYPPQAMQGFGGQPGMPMQQQQQGGYIQQPMGQPPLAIAHALPVQGGYGQPAMMVTPLHEGQPYQQAP